MLNKIKKISLTTISILTIILGCSSSNTKYEPDTTANPGDTIQTANPIITNIYLENSGSMFGYVTGHNDFKSVLAQLTADCELESEQVNYFMINALITSFGSDRINFVNELTKQGMNRGNTAISDLNKMFQIILSNAGEGKVSILISDGIYSVPSSGKLKDDLQNASYDTRNEFIYRLKSENLTTFLVKLQSNFDGPYYSYNGKITSISQHRPYYMWIIGTPKDLQSIFKEDYFEDLPGFQDIVKFVKLSGEEIKCQYVLHRQIGNMRWNPTTPLTLTRVQSGRGDITQFSIAFDFSNIPYSKNYFMNENIYQNNLDYNIEKVDIINAVAPAARDGLKGETYTHVVTFTKKTGPWGEMMIKIMDIIPGWIEETHDEDDLDIIGDTSHTLGFNDLIGGIAKAYDKVNKTENLFEVTFSIKIN